jgi:hypothetical protein
MIAQKRCMEGAAHLMDLSVAHSKGAQLSALRLFLVPVTVKVRFR